MYLDENSEIIDGNTLPQQGAGSDILRAKAGIVDGHSGLDRPSDELEDEGGQVNVIVWKQIAEKYRAALLNARLLGVVGELQIEGQVIHVIARRLFDHSTLLGDLTVVSRDFR